MGTSGRHARSGGRPVEVRVPELTGLRPVEARRRAAREDLLTTGPGADASEEWTGGVSGQEPSPGAWLIPGSAVAVWFGDDPGSDGSREPRKPITPTLSDHRNRGG